MGVEAETAALPSLTPTHCISKGVGRWGLVRRVFLAEVQPLRRPRGWKGLVAQRK